MIITKAKLKKIIKEEFDKDQVFASLFEKVWEGYDLEQIREIAMSFGELEEFYQFYRNSIFDMFFEKSERGYSTKHEWGTGPDALFVPYIHPISGKEVEIDIPIDWEEEESILHWVSYIVDEIMYQFPLTYVLRSSDHFKVKMGDEVFKALSRLDLI